MIPVAHVRLTVLAGAAGDCIGRAHEGRKRPTEPLVPPSPWRISDDTALTLATCRAIAETGRVDPAAIAAIFAREFRAGTYRDLGASTLKALRDLAQGAHWALAGRMGEFAAGNGAAMRIAPLAFLLTGEAPDERRLIRDVCRITHRNDEAYVAALAVVRAMHAISEGARGELLLARLADELPDTRVRDALRTLSDLPESRGPETAASVVGTSGHAAESVPFALYLAARFAPHCERAILAAVQCGGDTDTIASIAGQVCGAAGGAIPDSWLDRLPDHPRIERLADELASVARRRFGG